MHCPLKFPSLLFTILFSALRYRPSIRQKVRILFFPPPVNSFSTITRTLVLVSSPKPRRQRPFQLSTASLVSSASEKPEEGKMETENRKSPTEAKKRPRSDDDGDKKAKSRTTTSQKKDTPKKSTTKPKKIPAHQVLTDRDDLLKLWIDDGESKASGSYCTSKSQLLADTTSRLSFSSLFDHIYRL